MDTRCDTGVRALENIREGTYLGEHLEQSTLTLLIMTQIIDIVAKKVSLIVTNETSMFAAKESVGELMVG